MLELLISSSFRRSSSSALTGGGTGSYRPAGSKFLVLKTGLGFFVFVFFGGCFFFFSDNCHMTFSQHLQLSFFHQIKACDCITFSGNNKLSSSPSSSHQEHRGLLSVRYPMEHGIVTDWNDMERIWQYVYSKEQLQTFSEEVSSSPPLSRPHTSLSRCR